MGDIHIHIEANAVVVQPGDRLLISLGEHPPPDRMSDLMEQLRARFPGVEITVIPAANMVIQRDEEAP